MAIRRRITDNDTRNKKSAGGDFKKRTTGSKETSRSFKKDDNFKSGPRKNVGESGSRFDKRKSFSSDDKPKRTSRPYSSDKPERKRTGGYDDSSSRFDKRKSFSSDDKPKRTSRPYSSDRPERKRTGSYDDSSARFDKRKSFSSDDKPARTNRPFTKDRNENKREGGFKSKHEKPASTSSFSGKRAKSFDSERPVKRGYSRDGDDDKKRFTSKERGFKKSDNKGKSYGKRDSKLSKDTEMESGDIRLNRYISNAGICSRREADKLIGAGLVSVNNEIITEMGYQVKPGDVVKYNNSRLSTDKKVYIVMNKPKDVITTLDDPDGRRIVTDLLKNEDLPRVYPVGRLDRNTTGVLLLTNDGELAQRLMHPKYEVQKIYLATLPKNIKGEDLWTLTNGVELEDGFIKPDSIAIPDAKAKNEVGVEIHSGRNRIVHRMFEHVGYPLEKLDRVMYAGLSRKGLKRGEWRHLEPRELTALKKLIKLR